MYLYIKALHIIFIVAWFSGMLYIPRLFIYNTEAFQKGKEEHSVVSRYFSIMMTRLWYGIAWPSAILTLIFGPWMWYMYGGTPQWLFIKLVFVLLLYAYHATLHVIYKQQMKGILKYTSQQLRIWNEVATVFLVSIVMLVTVKQSLSFVWGLVGLICFIILLMSAIKIYKNIRTAKE